MTTPETIANYFERNTTGTALGKTISCLFNSFSSDAMAKEAAEYIVTQCHRTIQQSIMRGVVIFLRKMAASEYYDERNKASVRAAKSMIEAYDRENIRLPMI